MPLALGDFLEKWGRALFERPLAAAPKPEEPPELAEIRLAVLDQVREKSYRSGGRKVFPYDLLRIELRGVEESRAAIYAGRFFKRYIEQEVAAALAADGCRYPENLRVEVSTSVGLPQPGEEWLRVTAASQEQVAAAARPAGRLVVREGTASAPELLLDKARTNIGRVVDVYREGGLYRRNDLAFPGESAVNQTVSREHAHILYDRTSGEYRLFNDRWYTREGQRPAECGIWIVRDGMSLEVHRNPRGTRLENGDEIHFGQAVVVFQAE